MNYFTTDLYELKRDLANFSKKMSKGLDKPKCKFIFDMIYGLEKGKSALISNIARSLDESIKLKNTIERLCDNLINFSEEETKVLENNMREQIKKYIPDNELIALFDDSDISKQYGKKFEDLDIIRDGSNEGKYVKGYNVCSAVVLSKKEKQPLNVYQKVYSCSSEKFLSKNKYTEESIIEVIKYSKNRINMVFDRGYDRNELINYIDEAGHNFVIRMKNNRNFIFKNKIKNCEEVALSRKGKVFMNLKYNNKRNYEVKVSHTKVTLPSNKKDYELVIVYGEKLEEPMILLTNRSIKNKHDLITVVRLYMYRWRVEEYFKSIKQEYEYENIRVRKLKAINNINKMITIVNNYNAIIAEKMDNNLLSMKIIERSKSIKRKVTLWIVQISRGIREILSHAKTGIKELQKIESREKIRQLSLNI